MSPLSTSVLLAISRVVLATLFLPAGIDTLRNVSELASYFADLGFPASTAVAWGVAFELLGGLALFVGFQTRIVSLSLAAFAISAGIIGHYGQGDDATLAFMHGQALAKDVAIAGGLIALCGAGAGQLAVDALFEAVI